MRVHLTRLLMSMLCIGATSTSVHAATPTIVEAFDSNAAGFNVYNDALQFGWNATLGNPGGCITAVDDVSGVIWGFQAGPAFLGNKSCYAGGTLSFDMYVNITGGAGLSEPDIYLIGGGLTLAYDVPTPVNSATWTTRSAVLSPGSGWRLNNQNGALATQANFDAVLANLTAIRFRIEYRSGSDNGRLDNVVLAPAAIDPCGCDDIDFNNNGVFPEDLDVADYLSVLAGAECGACNDIDFNNNGVFPEDQDVLDFFNVLAGSECP